MRPQAVPIGGPGYQFLWWQAKFNHIAINQKMLFYPIVIEKLSALSIRLEYFGYSDKSYDVHIAWRSVFQMFDVFQKAAIEPLKSLHKPQTMKLCTEQQ